MMSGGAAVTLALLCGVCVIRTFIVIYYIIGALRIKYIIIDRLHTIHRYIMRLMSSEQIVVYIIIIILLR